MIDKKELRKLYKTIRKRISSDEKSCFDSRIFSFLINSDLYKNAENLLIYVSVNDEVDTLDIISRALSDGKKVAVPYCCGKKMKFSVIESFDDLCDGEFGIPTADPENCEVISDFNNTLCIVPGLSFDIHGNRLGYGGGFYDRFLSENPVDTVGLCYGRCLSRSIPSDKYDIVIKYILTENGLKKS